MEELEKNPTITMRTNKVSMQKNPELMLVSFDRPPALPNTRLPRPGMSMVMMLLAGL